MGTDTVPHGDKDLTFKFAHGANGRFLGTIAQLDGLAREVLNHAEYRNASNVPYLRTILAQSGVQSIAEGRPTEDLFRALTRGVSRRDGS